MYRFVILAEVTDRYNGTVDFTRIYTKIDSDFIGRVYNSVYDSEQVVHDHSDEDSEAWLDFGETSA